MDRVRICALTDIPDGDSAGYSVKDGEFYRSLLIIRRGDTVIAYRNSCPHEGDRMEHARGKFLDEEKAHILCASHGALFRIEDGVCIAGPCFGENLDPIVTAIEGGEVFVQV